MSQTHMKSRAIRWDILILALIGCGSLLFNHLGWPFIYWIALFFFAAANLNPFLLGERAKAWHKVLLALRVGSWIALIGLLFEMQLERSVILAIAQAASFLALILCPFDSKCRGVLLGLGAALICMQAADESPFMLCAWAAIFGLLFAGPADTARLTERIRKDWLATCVALALLSIMFVGSWFYFGRFGPQKWAQSFEYGLSRHLYVAFECLLPISLLLPFLMIRAKSVQRYLLLIFGLTATFALLEFTLRVTTVGLTHADGADSDDAHAPTLDLESVTRSKPAGTRRLLCLGDSVTYGAGCRRDSIYSEHLARILSKEHGDGFEVLNLSRIGWNTPCELGALKSDGIKYSPDLIVLGFVLNDAEPDGPGFHLATVFPRHLNSRLAWSYNINLLNFMYDKSLQLTGRKDDYTNYLLKLYREGERGWEQCKADHREMLRIAKEHNIRFLAVLFPAFVQFEDYPFQKVHESVGAWLQQQGAVTLDLLPYYKKYDPKDLIASFMDGHPNKLGHKIAADAIYETIRTHPDLKSFLD